LLRPALGAAALLVFVDSMKELPATLLLRPFNFDTLATQVFTLASLYRYDEAGLAALTIVVASLVPVLLLHGMIVAGRPGTSANRRETAASKFTDTAEGLLIGR
jgi:iron(III) transport system permease protein